MDSTITTRLFLLNRTFTGRRGTRPVLALHPALASVVIEGSVALAASRLAAKVGDAARVSMELLPDELL